MIPSQLPYQPLTMPRARKTDPVTSHEAADISPERLAESESVVMDVLWRGGSMTDPQIEVFAKRLRIERGEKPYSGQRLRTARKKLKEQGKVVACGLVRNGNNLNVQQWRAV